MDTISKSIVFAFAWIGLLHADVLLDSSLNPIFDFDPVDKNFTLNASFSTEDHPFIINQLKLLWRREEHQNGLIYIDLLNDNNVTLGAKLETLAEVDSGALPIGVQWLTIPIKTEKLLSAKTRYWIQIKATTATGALAYSRSHKGYGFISEYYLNSFGLRHNLSTGPYIFKVEGDPQK